MANEHDIFQLHDDHVEVTHREMWNDRVIGVTSTAISYPTFFNMLETAQGQEATVTNPVALYMQLLDMFGVVTTTFPKHLARLEYVQNRGVYITQIYGGANEPHIFSEINADKSRIAVRFFVNANRDIITDTIEVYRYSGIFAGTINRNDLTPLPVLSQLFRNIIGTDRHVSGLDKADMSELVTKIPSRMRLSAGVRQAINEAKNTNNEIRWEELA